MQFIRSVRYAFRGIVYAFRHEGNFRLQVAGAIAVLVAIFYLGTSKNETIVLLLLITAVLILELLNTAFEKFVDIVKPRLSDHVRVVKNVMAGAVLLTSITSVVIGIIIFLPYIVELTS